MRSCLRRSVLRRGFCTKKLATGAVKDLERSVSQHYNEVDYNMVDSLWGTGNYHLGYFPHLADSTVPEVCFEDAATLLTERMIEAAGINESSRVVDFGCGRGQGTLELIELARCETLGIDIADVNMEHCRQRIRELSDPGLPLEFAQASFTDLPPSVRCRSPPFTHVFSQQAFVHVHEYIDDVLRQAHSCLGDGGKLIVSDWLSLLDDGGGDKESQSQSVRDLVYERLELTHMLTVSDYRRSLEKAGFRIDMYEDLTRHAQHGAERLAQDASQRGFTEYARTWEETAAFFADRIIGVNLVTATKEK